MNVPLSALNEIPYLDGASLAGRHINLMPFWDGQDWHSWFPFPPEKLFYAKNNVVAVQYYWGTVPRQPSDIYIPFVDLMFQRVCFGEVFEHITSISADISNFSVSLAKIQHTFNTRAVINEYLINEFIATEIEYILTNSRSIFDHLHEIICWLWTKIEYRPDENGKVKRNQKLPQKLSSFLLANGEPRPFDEIVEKYGMPELLAKEFEKHSLLFSKIRKYRDAVIHKGSSVEFIFTTDQGFCVRYDQKPFADFYSTIDLKNYYHNENLVSLMPWIAYIIRGTIEACNNITTAFSKVFELPGTIAPDFKIYFWDHSGKSLLTILDIQDGGSPWWEETSLKS